MRMKTFGIAALAATTMIGAIAAAPDADAHGWRGGGWHGGGAWVGPAVIGGLALGAMAASAPYAYGGYYGCPRRVVGYTQWGRPIVRRVCY